MLHLIFSPAHCAKRKRLDGEIIPVSAAQSRTREEKEGAHRAIDLDQETYSYTVPGSDVYTEGAAPDNLSPESSCKYGDTVKLEAIAANSFKLYEIVIIGKQAVVVCEAGNFSNGSATCSKCEAGKYSAAGSTTCSECEAGKYSAAGSATCSECEAGKYSAAGSATCSECEAGKYSAGGSATCSECEAGKYSAGGSATCSECEAGKYSAAGFATCSECEAGKFSAAGSDSCSTCRIGKDTNSDKTNCGNCLIVDNLFSVLSGGYLQRQFYGRVSTMSS
ncbi:major surface trophozoite antigen 11-like [Bolinopsis microptera]|uniref:major surface trophozoite antigen 11-like n=1 Tax=Bolinopsis microptera TaxID=2820187 RepID=UPI003079507D